MNTQLSGAQIKAKITQYEADFLGYKNSKEDNAAEFTILLKNIYKFFDSINYEQTFDLISNNSTENPNMMSLIKAYKFLGFGAKKIRLTISESTIELIEDLIYRTKNLSKSINNVEKISSKKSLLDKAVEGLWERIPIGYKNNSADLKDKYLRYLNSSYNELATKAVSFAVAEGVYQINKNLAELLSITQGEMIHIALSVMQEDILTKEIEFKNKEVLLIKNRELMEPKLREIQRITKELIAISPEDWLGLELFGMVADDILDALNYRIEQKLYFKVLDNAQGERIGSNIFMFLNDPN